MSTLAITDTKKHRRKAIEALSWTHQDQRDASAHANDDETSRCNEVEKRKNRSEKKKWDEAKQMQRHNEATRKTLSTGSQILPPCEKTSLSRSMSGRKYVNCIQSKARDECESHKKQKQRLHMSKQTNRPAGTETAKAKATDQVHVERERHGQRVEGEISEPRPADRAVVQLRAVMESGMKTHTHAQ